LKTGDPFLPPDTDATGALEIVPVHDNVNEEVDGDGDPLNGCQTNELSIAKKSRGTMVIGVEESQRLLLEEQEDGVDEFKVFGKVVELFVGQYAINSHVSQFTAALT
jgi:hypothetical protein